jgi:anti-sigma-K factor RskA
MRMRRTLAQFEQDFREQAEQSVERRDRLRRQAVDRSRARRHERVARAGTLRFVLLATAIIVTAVIVTIVMFETLALLVG